MSKFLLNLIVQISKALVNLKIKFFILKRVSSSDFCPVGPAARRPVRPFDKASLTGPTRLSRSPVPYL
jgi:hypothetical protein